MFGVYVHWPYCLSKCPYCDFNSHVRPNIEEDPWVKGVFQEIDFFAKQLPGDSLDSIFLGGGTPSLASPKAMGVILEKLNTIWPFDPNIEITLEANPHTVEAKKFKNFKDVGINRVSIGVQSLRDQDLRFLGRKHDVKEAKMAIEIAQKCFDRLSFDLIYARPGQTLLAWEEELKEALQFGLSHYSLYQLTLEKGTSFYQAALRGDFALPEEELARDFYVLTQDIMNAEGLGAYEVSNHAVKGEESRHNLLYWNYGRFLGLGPGAHGRLKLGGECYALHNIKSPEIWAQKLKETGTGIKEKTKLTTEDQVYEFFLMGLRLTEGVTLQSYRQKIEENWEARLNLEQIKALQEQNFLNYDGSSLSLTLEGRLVLNKIMDLILK